jgi:hypothetical protein
MLRGKRKADARTVLPAAGSDLPVPDMPAGREWSAAERDRWEELWGSPQASQWDDSVKGTVALLVAYEAMLLAGGGSAWMAKEAAAAADALGLTPMSMMKLGWVIES